MMLVALEAGVWWIGEPGLRENVLGGRSWGGGEGGRGALHQCSRQISASPPG